MSPLLLLPFLFIGATALDGSEFYAKSFVEDFRNELRYKNYEYLISIVFGGYIFKTPSGQYEKLQAFERLEAFSNQYPSLSYDFVASNYLDKEKKQIKFSLDVHRSGDSQRYFFRIKEINGKWILMNGYSEGFPESKHRNIVAQNHAWTTAEEFLASLDSALKAQDQQRISDKFSKKFFFRGCDGTYYKEEVIDQLAVASNAGGLSMELKEAFSVPYDKEGVSFTVLLSGLGNPIDAQFVLYGEEGSMRLVAGSVPKCQKSDSHFAAQSADEISQSFLASFSVALKSQDQNRIGQMFADGFKFRECNSQVYDKKQLIAALTAASNAGVLSMDFQSARFSKKQDVVFIVLLNGFGVPVRTRFVLHMEKGQYILIRGKVLSCLSHRKGIHGRD